MNTVYIALSLHHTKYFFTKNLCHIGIFLDVNMFRSHSTVSRYLANDLPEFQGKLLKQSSC